MFFVLFVSFLLASAHLLLKRVLLYEYMRVHIGCYQRLGVASYLEVHRML